MSLKTKLVYIVKHTNNLNTIIHATRRGKNLEFNPKQITQEGKNIITDNIGINLIKINNQKEWNRFANLEKINLYEEIKQETISQFKEQELPFKAKQKDKYLTQYIVSLSPHFWEQKKMIEYKSLMIDDKVIKWGVNHVVNEKELTIMFDTIGDSIKTQREQVGINNFVASIIHLDEKTPHMHMFFINIVKQNQKPSISIKHEPKYLKMREEINQNLYEKHHLKIQEKENMSHTVWKQNLEKVTQKKDKEQLQPLSPLELQDEKIKKWEQENLFKKEENRDLTSEISFLNKDKKRDEKDYKREITKEPENEHER